MKKIVYSLLLASLAACTNADKPAEEPSPAPETPKSISYSIVKTYPHDTASFTEGLLVYNGSLYESTGMNGSSKLLKVDLNSGKAEKEVKLDSVYFGEGIVILNDTIYQLTYRQQLAFVYTLKDFKKIKELPFATDSKEGWGMTTDGTYLVATDGTNNLYYYEPSTFRLVKKLSVTEAGSPAFNLNELEYIDGYIYANQWQYSYILKIDPADGKVVGKIDLSQVADNIKAKFPFAEFMNGIAYDGAAKKMYITGKWWPELYEINLSK